MEQTTYRNNEQLLEEQIIYLEVNWQIEKIISTPVIFINGS